MQVTVSVHTIGSSLKFRCSTHVRHSQLVHGQLVCAGALHKPILSDESTFVIEDESSGATHTRLLTVTLTKRDATGGKMHWPCVVSGDPKIDVARFGPQLLTADPDCPQDLIEKMKMMELPN